MSSAMTSPATDIEHILKIKKVTVALQMLLFFQKLKEEVVSLLWNYAVSKVCVCVCASIIVFVHS